MSAVPATTAFWALARALAVAAVLALWFAAPAWAQGASTPQSAAAVVSARDLTQRAASGEPVHLVGATLDGDLELHTVGTLTRPFRCQRCRLRGSLRAPDVVFERMLELSDSTVEGQLDLRGAVFRDRVTFEGTRFLGPAAVATASFLGDASFGRGSFASEVSFRATKFQERADFIQQRFSSLADFSGAVFVGGVSFLLAEFADSARFEGADLRGASSFRLVRLQDGASFDRVSSQSLLEFNGAVFEGDVSLTTLSSSGSISLMGILFRHARLFMDQLSVRDLSMEVGTVDVIRGPQAQKDVLELIERSAQQRGDLSIANDARYKLLSVLGREKDDAIGGLVDNVFYRAIAGYLVRPLHPLMAFLWLLAAATLARSVLGVSAALRRSPPSNPDETPARRSRVTIDRWRGALLRLEKAVTVALSSLATGIAVAFRPKPGDVLEDHERVGAYFVAGVRWAEFIAYKLLIAVFLLALGNSNATVREILDTVRS